MLTLSLHEPILALPVYDLYDTLNRQKINKVHRFMLAYLRTKRYALKLPENYRLLAFMIDFTDSLEEHIYQKKYVDEFMINFYNYGISDDFMNKLVSYISSII
jgi:hypothetical protein